MNRHVATPEPVTHEAAQQLLPWLLAGTLDSAELAMVQSHLQTCAQCQADLAWQRRLREAAPPPDAAVDADRAFAQLLPRLGPQATRIGVLEHWRKASAANGAWLRWTALAQLAAIRVLSVLLARPGNDAVDYRALNAPWGMAMAPANFGTFSNDLLVANFGDGKINAYNSSTGKMDGTLSSADGMPIVIDGLWGIAFGNGVNSQPTNTLFFTAGPSDEAHGLYGRIDMK